MSETPSPQTLNSNPQSTESDNPTPRPDLHPASIAPPPPPPLPPQSTVAPTPTPASLPSYAPPVSGIPPPAPSFRPAVPQFSPLPGAVSYQSPGVQPPGVGSAPGMVPGAVIAGVPQPPPPMVAYQVPLPGQPPNAALRPYMPMPNGYVTVPGASQPPPGLPSYSSPYPGMVRPVFPPRPPGALGVLPTVSRPPVPVVPGVRPIVPPVVRPALVPVTPAEKPQTTVYVSKIAPSVENDFMLSVLQLCGPVKSWKRPQDPSTGTPKGFGFCEFESAEGVLRAMRLLSKLNIDGQELALNVDQATKDYLGRYVERKSENLKKLKENEVAGAEKEGDGAPNSEKKSPKSSEADSKKDDPDSSNKESHDNSSFGIVTDEDREADKEASEKLRSMIEERLKTKPLPPPPPQVPVDSSGNTISETPAKSRDRDSDADHPKTDAEDRNDEETTSDNRATSEHDKTETSSPDRNRRYDRRSREHDRERDSKREKEREVERYEREAERERVRKEREQRRKVEEAEREYEERLKDWEYREREKEKQRQYDREREKERERKRKKEIIYDEEDEDDDSRKRWHRSLLEEKRKKRLREKEDDLVDRRKEEEEIAESKKRAEEIKRQQQQQQREAIKLFNGVMVSGYEKNEQAEEPRGENVQQDSGDGSGHETHAGEVVSGSVTGDDSTFTVAVASDVPQSNNVPAKKLGFGLVGSGKRTAVPSVFHEEDDEDSHKEKKMRPLVPIDYSTEEMQAIQPNSGQPQPNLAAAAEYAKRLSSTNMKEEKTESERERSKRSHDRSSQREKERNDIDSNRSKDENKDNGQGKLKTTETKKLLDAKQLIDMIPRTKEDLFSYEINWALYDQHELHERMRPWISKKIMEFLGEEETSLVDYIVTSTQEHVKATEMLETLKSILDEEAEMFVLKMWRMLIFEIKKVETGLHMRSRS